jgi:hypothetical protein
MPTELKALWGVKAYGSNTEAMESYSLNVSAFPLNKDNKNMVNEFFDSLGEIDSAMIKYGLQHSEAIFGKGKKYKEGKHEAVVEALYTPTVKHGEDKEGNPYPRRFNAKVRGVYDSPERPNVQVYLSSKDNINDNSFTFENLCELIPAGTFIDMICQPNIWFISGKFGISWTVVQVKVKQTKSKVLKSYAFSEDDGSDDEDNSEDEVGGNAAEIKSKDVDAEDSASDKSEAEDSEEDKSDAEDSEEDKSDAEDSEEEGAAVAEV